MVDGRPPLKREEVLKRRVAQMAKVINQRCKTRTGKGPGVGNTHSTRCSSSRIKLQGQDERKAKAGTIRQKAHTMA